jgi:drug/metabolite transporter (DMT)-like permease
LEVIALAWIYLAAFYGVAKGLREFSKKEALKKTSVPEALFLYTLISFLLILPFSHDAFAIGGIYYLYIAIKSFVIFLSWIISFYVIKKMPISLYGVVDMGKMIFAALLGVAFLREAFGFYQGLGLILIAGALFVVNFQRRSRDERDKENVKIIYVLLMLVYCFLNSISSLLDKIILRDGEVSSSQLQFWYVAYLIVFYGIYMIFTKTKIHLSTLKHNYFIPIMSLLLVLGDRALLIANASPSSSVGGMSVLKELSVVVYIILGKILYKEKHILKRAICAFVIVLGILIYLI